MGRSIEIIICQQNHLQHIQKKMDASPQCRVCLIPTEPNTRVQLKCQHIFCSTCVKQYIEVLRNYNLLTPEKLCCLEENCKQEIDDAVMMKLFPGELGFIFNIIKKRYRESKDPNTVIFDCKGYITVDRKPIIIKPESMSKQQHLKQINSLVNKITKKQQNLPEHAKTCKNILSFNRSVPRKQNYVQCNICLCGYCLSCYRLLHDGSCEKTTQQQSAILNKNTKQTDKTNTNNNNQDQIDNFVQRNGILRCLNQKCRVAIAKEEGCYWIKCRCSWEMCYPCQKLWGDCEHFKNYPYKKFIPPAQWMVKALNLY